MKAITTILCICCLPVAAQNSQKASQKVLFEKPIVRVVELGNNNEPLHYDGCSSLLITVDSRRIQTGGRCGAELERTSVWCRCALKRALHS